MTNCFTPVDAPLHDLNVKLVGAAPVNRNNIVVLYDNGTIFLQNIEKELLDSSAETKKKAIRLLGLDLENSGESSTPASSGRSSKVDERPKSAKKSKSSKKKEKDESTELTEQMASFIEDKNEEKVINDQTSSETLEVIFKPNWNPQHTSITCFEVCTNRLAIAGKNLDLKVFDLTTKQCIFTAKSSNKDWLGLKSAIWVSDMAWIGPILPPKPNANLYSHKISASVSPAMIATCSRSDPIVRIYDVKCKTKKPIWCINLKDSTFNNDSNPPSFTSITSTVSPVTSAVPTQQLILGTTMGRMIAIELRFNSRSHRQLGVFKGFGGGAIRDISFVASCGSAGNHKVVSCALDRFVRVHSFRTGANTKRQIDSKYYVKTRPTCVQPILSSYLVNDGENSEVDSVANIESESDIECDDYDED
jgi:hypothetical protein